MNRTKIYLDCDCPPSGFKPIRFTQNPTPKTTHFGYWEDRIAIPQQELINYPSKQTQFGVLITPTFHKQPWIVVLARFTKRGYQPERLLLPHQTYHHLMMDMGILPTIFPLWKIEDDESKCVSDDHWRLYWLL